MRSGSTKREAILSEAGGRSLVACCALPVACRAVWYVTHWNVPRFVCGLPRNSYPRSAKRFLAKHVRILLGGFRAAAFRFRPLQH